jgi:hypothetical protein
LAHFGHEIWPTNQTKPGTFVPEGAAGLDWRAKVERYEEIRREYEKGVGTILGVARKLGVHRRTVREAVESAIPPKRKTVVREATRMVREVVLFIHGVLEQDQQAPRKQRTRRSGYLNGCRQRCRNAR